jgi:hypothetical protein
MCPVALLSKPKPSFGCLEGGPVEALDSLSGYVPEYLYELGRIDTTKPFADWEKLGRVDERARPTKMPPSRNTHQARAAEAGTAAVVRDSDSVNVRLE